MADFSARVETELVISDTYMEANFANPSAEIDVVKRLPAEAFAGSCLTVPMQGANHSFMTRGVSIDFARSSQGGIDGTAVSGLLNRCLHNHQSNQNSLCRYTCGNTHLHGVRYIYPYLSTARGVRVYD